MTDKHPAAVPETKDQVHHASDSDRGATDFQAIARLFHDTYERLAPQFGYETRKDTRQFDPESPNGKLMIAVCAEVQAALLDVREGYVCVPVEPSYAMNKSGARILSGNAAELGADHGTAAKVYKAMLAAAKGVAK